MQGFKETYSKPHEFMIMMACKSEAAIINILDNGEN